MAFWNRFFGSAGSQAAGIAIGATAVPALIPAVQFLENQAWETHPDKPPDVYLLAQGVAQGQVDEGSARTWSHQQGIGDGAFDALIAAADTGPAFGELLDAYRRGLIGDAGFDTGLHRLAIETQWWPALRGLKRLHLSPAEAANARQQGFIPDAAQIATAGLWGIDAGDAEVQYELAGLPPGVETGLAMLRRGIIDEPTFRQIVREGHTKTKYTDDLLQTERELLSAATAVRAHLKGHITADQMHQRGDQWGYTPADMDLWYQSEGRPATTHQIHIGYARGASVPGAANEHEAIIEAVAQSDVRPEYGELLYASRYTYPSAFVLRSLVQSGALTAQEGEDALLFSGWEPTFAAKVAASWAGGSTGGAADAHVGKAETQLWTTTHRSYIDEEIDDTAARDALTTLAIDGAAQDQILALWQKERGLVRKQLTPAQLKKAWQGGVTNPATGAAWTREEALAELVDRGYSPEDAAVFLDL